MAKGNKAGATSPSKRNRKNQDAMVPKQNDLAVLAEEIMNPTEAETEQQAKVVEENQPIVLEHEPRDLPAQRKADTEPKPQQTKKVKVLPTLDEALDIARKENPHRFAHVERVTELTNDGSPKRVVIRCTDPQTKMEGGKEVSVCEGTREIAIQDLFQVYRCTACADRVVRKARRLRSKARVKRAKQLLKAREER
jgi:hypothetical protein